MQKLSNNENIPLRFQGKYGRFIDWEKDGFSDFGGAPEMMDEPEVFNPHTTVIKGSRMNDMPTDDLPF